MKNVWLSLGGITSDLQVLMSTNLTHDELGERFNFREVEEQKNHLCGDLIDLMQKLEMYESDFLNTEISNYSLMLAKNLLSIKDIVKHVNILTNNGVHDKEFPNIRNKLIDNSKKLRCDTTLENFEPRVRIELLEINKRFSDFKEHLESDNQIQKTQSLLSTLEFNIKKSEVTSKELDEILVAAQSKIHEKGVKDTKSNYLSLIKAHNIYQWTWVCLLAAFSCLLAVSVYNTFYLEIANPATSADVISFFKRLLLIGFPLLFLKICLTKYNAERNLVILYKNREQVLSQYETLVKGTTDENAKNEMRNAIASYIFSDPLTNYSSVTANNDVSISPVIGVLEKLVKLK